MKKTLLSLAGISAMLCVLSCKDKNEFELNTNFNPPTELTSPASVTIDLQSTTPVVLEWSGGGADDGSLLQYDVLFAAANGNFDAPLQTMPSDLGALQKLTLTHVQLNTLARQAGIVSNSTGTLQWTVRASKAGTAKNAAVSKSISITRGEGLDNYPAELYLHGSGIAGAAGETEGRAFRQVEEGVFQIYTALAAGDVHFKSGATNGEVFDYYEDYGVLREGSGAMPVTATADSAPVRITVDFNALSVTMEVISNVRCIWGATFDVIGALSYIGGGIFEATNCNVVFVDPSRPETNPPTWLTWTDERYYFIAEVDGNDKCWGRNDGVSAERPIGGESLSFYELGEFTWDQWEHLWKMSGSLDMKSCKITINTDLEGSMAHQFSDIGDLVGGGGDNVTHTPTTLYLFGTGSLGTNETEGRAFRQVSTGVFHIYTNLAAGDIQFSSTATLGSGGYTYYDNSGLKEGSGTHAVAATTGNPVRLTVNFNTLTVTKEEISDLNIHYLDGNGGDPAYHTVYFTYQGAGNFKAEVPLGAFNTNYWNTIAVYKFSLKINAVDSYWGNEVTPIDNSVGQYPIHGSEPAAYYKIYEYDNSNYWDYRYRFAESYQNKTFDITIFTNTNGMMYHEIDNIR